MINLAILFDFGISGDMFFVFILNSSKLEFPTAFGDEVHTRTQQ